MSSYYEPDYWKLIEIRPNELYKVFGTWDGGPFDADDWRLNSGINAVIFPDESYSNSFLIGGYSGSTYKCYTTNYGCVSYLENVLQSLKKKAERFNHPIRIIESYDEALSILEKNFRHETTNYMDDRT